MKGISDFNTTYNIAYLASSYYGEKYVIMQLEDGSYAFQKNPNGFFKVGMIDIVGNKILEEI